uniref:Uncharacterized protein n=1 Tax=Lygus hesperus TaxID=30085 RepID=A0A146MF90_LYGHE
MQRFAQNSHRATAVSVFTQQCGKLVLFTICPTLPNRNTRFYINLWFINAYAKLMSRIFARNFIRKVTQHSIKVTIAVCTVGLNGTLTHQVVVLKHYANIVAVKLAS